jgi:uncharacterized protein YjiK
MTKSQEAFMVLARSVGHVALFTLFICDSLSAQSIAALLGSYQITLKKEITAASASQISGGAFDPTTGTLLVVDNGNCTVFEVTTAGELLNTITLSKFDDVEGIAYEMGSNFIVAEEARGNVVRISIPASRTGSIDWNNCEKLNIGTGWNNTGLEDVSYDALSHTGFGVKEKSPTAIFGITFDTNGKPLESHEIKSFNWNNIKGDAAGVYALDDGNILLLSQEGNTLYGVDTNGKVLSQIQLGMTQAEGVTFNKADKTIYIVGESHQLSVLKLNSSTDIRTAGHCTFQLLHRSPGVPAWMSVFSVSLLGRRFVPDKSDAAPLLHNHRSAIQHGTVYLH